MAKSSVLYVRLDTDLKNKAENVLAQLGITPSSAIQMFYSQIILRNGMPFDIAVPEENAANKSKTPVLSEEDSEENTMEALEILKRAKLQS